MRKLHGGKRVASAAVPPAPPGGAQVRIPSKRQTLYIGSELGGGNKIPKRGVGGTSRGLSDPLSSFLASPVLGSGRRQCLEHHHAWWSNGVSKIGRNWSNYGNTFI